MTSGLVALAVVAGFVLVGCGGGATPGPGAGSTSGEAVKDAATGWRSTPVSESGAGNFASVACPAAGDCWATADIESHGSNSGQIYHFEGQGWRRVPTPGRALSLYGIACPTSSACWAVGATESNAGTISTLVERLDGGSWTIEESPDAGGFPESGLTAIACHSATDCWAAGDGQDFSQEPTAGELLVLHYAGGSWSRVAAPSPEEEEQTGDGALLSCGSVDECVLLTNFGSHGGETSEQVGDLFDGHGWRALELPPGILFQALACPAAGDCIAVGGPRFNEAMSAYHFDGSGWSAPEPLPAAVGANPVSWYALDCPARGECWAAGGQPIDGAALPAAVAAFRNGEWSIPSQAEEPGQLTGISCSSTTSCMAVGGASVSRNSFDAKPLALGLSP